MEAMCLCIHIALWLLQLYKHYLASMGGDFVRFPSKISIEEVTYPKRAIEHRAIQGAFASKAVTKPIVTKGNIINPPFL